jgi:hypothetical protein
VRTRPGPLPCATAAGLAGALIAAVTLSAADDPASWCGTGPDGARHALALHAWAAGAPAASRTRAFADTANQSVGGRSADADGVALLADRGDLLVSRNPFDLDGRAVRLVPNGAGGYDAVALSLPLDAPAAPLAVGEETAATVDLPFAFPFYGQRHRAALVSADGRVLFGAPDTGTGDKGLGRFLAGPPSVAAFFTDLDPARGGSITAGVQADRVALVWSAVPGGGQINRNTFEIVLHASGEIDLVYGTMESREAVAGVTPGGTLELTRADLSATTPAGSSGALVERFSETEKVDLVSVLRRFYASHDDAFEQVVVYTTRPLNPAPGTLAFELNVKNAVTGIGVEIVDGSAAWGSRGALESVVYMDAIDPYVASDGFEFLAHEVGHRWLAHLGFRDGSGATSTALLGRGAVHWSFFLDTQASVLEGNSIRDLGGGRFETVDFARGYSALDQYAMGLRAPADVPAFFYVESPDDFQPTRTYKAGSSPEAGVRFRGVRRDVRIDQVLAAMGPRVPPAGAAPTRLRQAYVLVSDSVAPATDVRRAAVARIRSRFEPYYRKATDGRGDVQTELP